MRINRQHNVNYPFYMEFFHNKIYSSAAACAKNDSVTRCNLKMFWCYKKMVNEVTKELKQGGNVCQFGINFGNLIDEVAISIGNYGIYDIIDINPLELKRIRDKYGDLYKQIALIQDDIAFLNVKAIRDNVICFMLLSMVPDSYKRKIIDNALLMLKPNGKAIFIDWGRPKKYNVLGWGVKMYQQLYRPLTDKLHDVSIKSMSSYAYSDEFIWQQTGYLGGLLQKVVVTRREIALPKSSTSKINPKSSKI